MWSSRLTSDGDPAPRTSQASLMVASFQGGGLLVMGKQERGSGTLYSCPPPFPLEILNLRSSGKMRASTSWALMVCKVTSS